MSWKHAWLIFLVCFGFVANAQDNRTILLRQACRQFDSALVKKDTAKLNTLLAVTFRIEHSNGLEETKKELLQHLGGGFLKYDEIIQKGEATITFDEELGHVDRDLSVRGALDGSSFSVNLETRELWIWNYDTRQWKLRWRQSKKTE